LDSADRRIDLAHVLRAEIRLRIFEDVAREHTDDELAVFITPAARAADAGERRGGRGLAA
jgi:hypothetical protein